MSRVAGESKDEFDCTIPRTPERKGKGTLDRDLTNYLPHFPGFHLRTRLRRPWVGLEGESEALPPGAALRALTMVASPKWLWLPAPLSRGQPGF